MAGDQGRYEVRDHMVAGVLAVYWIDEDSPRGDLMMVLGEDRLPMLAAAIAVRLKADAQARPVPVQPTVPPGPREVLY